MELKHIGRYDIKGLIGQGGMSAVYLGYDPRSLREVAIKVLPPYYLHAQKFRERFEREALMIALLEHPAIVPVYDMGEEDGQPYIVMRYMSGGSLAEKIKKGPIPLRECMEMYLRLAPALDTAHARGVTHRDVKPDNLLFDKYDNVFLSDFGLARLRETIGFTNISDGSIMGTPAYMSPEQIQGDHEIDGRSDIYSLGVVLYHMLCGSVPYDGATAASVMMMHLINPVPEIRLLNKSLPVGIQAILEKAMSKNPKDRYQSAGEFAKAIQAVTTGVFKKPVLHNGKPIATNKPEKPSIGSLPPVKPAGSRRTHRDSSDTPAKNNGTVGPIPVGKHDGQTPVAPSNAGNISASARASAPPASSPEPLLRKIMRSVPTWGWVLSITLIFILSLTVFQWYRDGFPFSLLPDATPIPESNNSSNSPGQADKLAFLNESNIWVSNLDGSGLVRLTTDGLEKSHLNWSPDGNSILFTSGNCLSSVELESAQVQSITCFTGTDSIKAFDISQDGQTVAIGLDESDLYLIPYAQLQNLPQTSLPFDLLALAQCSYYSPFQLDDPLKAVYFSDTKDHLAVVTSEDLEGSERDKISVLDFSQCSASPQLVQEILPTYFLFTLRGYYDHPEISNVSWANDDQLLLNGFLNKEGFGNLQLYNFAQNQGQEIAPNGPCCYRDANWSPDGAYLFYTYQPEDGGDIRLFYAPLAEVKQPSGDLASLPLPSGFFASSFESLQPALRTAH